MLSNGDQGMEKNLDRFLYLSIFIGERNMDNGMERFIGLPLKRPLWCKTKPKMSSKKADVPPTNQAKSYRALLHQVIMTYWQMQMYPVQIYPRTNHAYSYRAWLHQVQIYTPLIKPRATEPYFHR